MVPIDIAILGYTQFSDTPKCHIGGCYISCIPKNVALSCLYCKHHCCCFLPMVPQPFQESPRSSLANHARAVHFWRRAWRASSNIAVELARSALLALGRLVLDSFKGPFTVTGSHQNSGHRMHRRSTAVPRSCVCTKKVAIWAGVGGVGQ